MVMSWIWFGILAVSVLCGFLTGRGEALAGALLEGAQSGITLGISIAGSLCLWSGVGRLMESAGITQLLARVFSPLLCRVFPSAKRNELLKQELSANICANFLGLGNAATPMGIAAVKRMQQLAHTSAATDEMCRLIVMNTASIQLLPTTVAAVRASLGAAAPFDILPAGWITSAVSVAAGLLSAQLFRRFSHA